MSLLARLRLNRNLLSSSLRYGKHQIKGDHTTRYDLSNGELESPGDYFKYKYVFDDHPETMGRFMKNKTDEYNDRVLYEWDNFIFAYHGEWWDMGKPWLHFMFAGIFVATYVFFKASDVEADTKGWTKCSKRDPTGTGGLIEFAHWSYK